MSCLAAFPSMDAASVKPLAALLGFWVRYIVMDVDELDAPPGGRKLYSPWPEALRACTG